jgi:hypothetical protein
LRFAAALGVVACHKRAQHQKRKTKKSRVTPIWCFMCYSVTYMI